MAVTLGKNFRRLLAQALAADQDEMRALIERVLPPGEDGKRALRLKNKDDRQLAPLAIVAAFSVDAITGDEAEQLKRQAVAEPIDALRSFWESPPPDMVCLSPDERRRLGYRPRWGLQIPPCGVAAKSGAAIVNNNENTMAENNDVAQAAPGQTPNTL